MSIIVPGRGPAHARVMLVGEAPGREEAEAGKPFVGKAGREQDRYLANAGLHRSTMYMTNLVKQFVPGNPDPTPEMIREWGPQLLQEVASVKPDFIIAVGRFATKFFIGDDLTMDQVHAIPHQWLDGTTIIPVTHPASGFYDDDARPIIASDYVTAGRIIRGELPRCGPADEYPDPVYIDVDYPIDFWPVDVLGIDTEGVPGDEWSIQVSLEPGTAFIFRRSSDSFETNIRRLQRLIDQYEPIVVLHNGMYDIEMCRLQGLDLFDARLFDTMYGAYLLRTEPQALKTLAYRTVGMRMSSYEETVGPVGLEKQLNYLGQILEYHELHGWPKPEPEIVHNNDGTAKLYTPQPVWKRAEAILNDFYSEKRDKDGNPVDPFKRWRQVHKPLRKMVESKLGPMPIGTLADIPLERAVSYAGRDSDAVLRIYPVMVRRLREMRILGLMADGAMVLPIFEEMQSTGFGADIDHFIELRDEMWQVQCRLQSYISHHYFDDRPFNPNSSDQVATVMRRRGLRGEKRTSSGKMSTSKKSIEHLRYEDDAIAKIIDWREHGKIKDSFCSPIIEILEDDPSSRVRCTIKTTRVASRRIAATDPPLAAIPVRHKLGLRVRDGFVAAEGHSLGSWDLSQIEMRYMAHLSRDPLLVKFFQEDRDVHKETAARIFGIKLDDVEEMAHRYPAKRAGFGIITNIQGAGLLDQLRMFGCQGWDEDSCDNLIREWLKVYRGVAQFLGDCKREVRQTGVVRDIWGHIRYLPGVWSDEPRVRAEAERAASSHKIQGGAQGMIQKSMIWLRPYIRGLAQAGESVRWVMQIHDEVILEFTDDLWDTLDPLVREGLTEHSLKLIVPVKCSGNKAKRWGGLK